MQPLDQTEIVAVVTLETELAPNLGFLYSGLHEVIYMTNTMALQ